MGVEELDVSAESIEGISEEAGLFLERNFELLRTLLGPGEGITDTFTTVDGKTVTVKDGIITGIV